MQRRRGTMASLARLQRASEWVIDGIMRGSLSCVVDRRGGGLRVREGGCVGGVIEAFNTGFGRGLSLFGQKWHVVVRERGVFRSSRMVVRVGVPPTGWVLGPGGRLEQGTRRPLAAAVMGWPPSAFLKVMGPGGRLKDGKLFPGKPCGTACWVLVSACWLRLLCGWHGGRA